MDINLSIHTFNCLINVFTLSTLASEIKRATTLDTRRLRDSIIQMWLSSEELPVCSYHNHMKKSSVDFIMQFSLHVPFVTQKERVTFLLSNVDNIDNYVWAIPISTCFYHVHVLYSSVLCVCVCYVQEIFLFRCNKPDFIFAWSWNGCKITKNLFAYLCCVVLYRVAQVKTSLSLCVCGCL